MPSFPILPFARLFREEGGKSRCQLVMLVRGFPAEPVRQVRCLGHAADVGLALPQQPRRPVGAGFPTTCITASSFKLGLVGGLEAVGPSLKLGTSGRVMYPAAVLESAIRSHFRQHGIEGLSHGSPRLR